MFCSGSCFLPQHLTTKTVSSSIFSCVVYHVFLHLEIMPGISNRSALPCGRLYNFYQGHATATERTREFHQIWVISLSVWIPSLPWVPLLFSFGRLHALVRHELKWPPLDRWLVLASYNFILQKVSWQAPGQTNFRRETDVHTLFFLELPDFYICGARGL